MERENTNNNTLGTITTGLNNLDEALGGFHDGELILLASRPAVGKTNLALNMVNHLAIGKGYPCLFLSMEHSKEQMEKWLAIMGGDETFETLYHIDGKANQFIYLEDGYLNIDAGPELYKVIKKYKKEQNIQFVVIDYLQLYVKRRTEEQLLLRKLKALAMELNIPILVTSQLERSMEYGDGREPQLKDFDHRAYLRETPDVFIILTGNGYYNGEGEPPASHDAELTVLKSPCGFNGIIKATWVRDKLLFLDREE